MEIDFRTVLKHLVMPFTCTDIRSSLERACQMFMVLVAISTERSEIRPKVLYVICHWLSTGPEIDDSEWLFYVKLWFLTGMIGSSML